MIEESLTFRVGTKEEDLWSDLTKDQNLDGEEEITGRKAKFPDVATCTKSDRNYRWLCLSYL